MWLSGNHCNGSPTESSLRDLTAFLQMEPAGLFLLLLSPFVFCPSWASWSLHLWDRYCRLSPEDLLPQRPWQQEGLTFGRCSPVSVALSCAGLQGLHRVLALVLLWDRTGLVHADQEIWRMEKLPDGRCQQKLSEF